MATVYNQTVHTGNTLLIKINGVEIGRAQGLDGRRSFGTQGVYEIGSIMPKEHVQTRYEGTISLERFFVRTSTLITLGIGALGEDVLTKDIMDIEVVDKYTGQVIRIYRGCSISDYSETVRVGQICGENATLQYLECSNGSADTSAQ